VRQETIREEPIPGSKLVRDVIPAVLFFGLSLAAPLAVAQTAPDKVKIEWLGHEFYRFTSPKGVTIITSPWLANPD